MARRLFKGELKANNQGRLNAFSSLVPDIKQFVVDAQQLEEESNVAYIKSMYNLGYAAATMLQSSKKCGHEQVKYISRYLGKRQSSIYDAVRIVRVYNLDYILDFCKKGSDKGVSITWSYLVILSYLDQDEQAELRRQYEDKIIGNELRHSILKNQIFSIVNMMRNKRTAHNKVDSSYDEINNALNLACNVLGVDSNSFDGLDNKVQIVVNQLQAMTDKVPAITMIERLAPNLEERFNTAKQAALQKVKSYDIPITIYDLGDDDE